jgi:hypothetical protein
MKRAIVIQGPSTHVNELKRAWDGYDLIWSTWSGEDSHYQEDDIVVYSPKPNETGFGNVNLQKVSTYNGVLKAKELGYDRVFKWRSDMIPTNAEALLGSLSEDINILFYHHVMPDRSDYFVDYVMESETDTMINIWSFTNIYPTHAEAIITEYINQQGKKVSLFGGKLNNDNDILWLKKNISIKDYKKYPAFEYDK